MSEPSSKVMSLKSDDDASADATNGSTCDAIQEGTEEEKKEGQHLRKMKFKNASDVDAIRQSEEASSAIPFVCLSAGLSRKASPSQLKSWIALSLTLDGRDKITKVCQYSSRIIAWYYESLARSVEGVATTSLLGKAARYRGLQAKLTESRKAYRLGRSLVELDKISRMGWGNFLAYHLRHLIEFTGEGDCNRNGASYISAKDSHTVSAPSKESDGCLSPSPHHRREPSNVDWGPNTMIAADGTASLSRDCTSKENERSTSNNNQDPPRLLLRRASTNIGWGPANSVLATVPASTESTTRRSSSFYRSVSNLGRRIYRPLASQLVISYGADADGVPPPVPAWKIIGSTLKILGLMGFWLGDNVNFLGSSGVLDDMNLPKEARIRARGELRRRAGYFAARTYFVGAVSGFYVSLRDVLRHRNGPLRMAVERVHALEIQKMSTTKCRALSNTEDENYLLENIDSSLQEAQSDLESIKGKQFVLFLALLKSCCDVVVFSNNPGVDLHKEYRGKKMNEGFHSVCGLISASTVLYNNFPNNK